MTISSVGYAGTVSDEDWARMVPKVGSSKYGVVSYSDWRPTAAGAGDRAVTIATGVAWGHGVMDTNSAPVTVNLASVPSGVRYDLIVAHRNWNTSTTTITVIQGGSQSAIPTRDTTPGNEDDQPLALVRVAAGSTSIQAIIDARVVVGTGGAHTFDDEGDVVRQYLNDVGTKFTNLSFIHERIQGNAGPEWVRYDVKDTNWLAFDGIVAGATNFTGNPGNPDTVLFYRRLNGVVYLRGSLYRAPAAAVPFDYVTGLQLPIGFRPLSPVAVTTRDGVSVAVLRTGEIQVSSTIRVTTGLGYPLGGISFPAG